MRVAGFDHAAAVGVGPSAVAALGGPDVGVVGGGVLRRERCSRHGRAVAWDKGTGWCTARRSAQRRAHTPSTARTTRRPRARRRRAGRPCPALVRHPRAPHGRLPHRDNRDEGAGSGHAGPGTRGHAGPDPRFPRKPTGDRPRRVHPPGADRRAARPAAVKSRRPPMSPDDPERTSVAFLTGVAGVPCARCASRRRRSPTARRRSNETRLLLEQNQTRWTACRASYQVSPTGSPTMFQLHESAGLTRIRLSRGSVSRAR